MTNETHSFSCSVLDTDIDGMTATVNIELKANLSDPTPLSTCTYTATFEDGTITVPDLSRDANWESFMNGSTELYGVFYVELENGMYLVPDYALDVVCIGSFLPKSPITITPDTVSETATWNNNKRINFNLSGAESYTITNDFDPSEAQVTYNLTNNNTVLRVDVRPLVSGTVSGNVIINGTVSASITLTVPMDATVRQGATVEVGNPTTITVTASEPLASITSNDYNITNISQTSDTVWVLTVDTYSTSQWGDMILTGTSGRTKTKTVGINANPALVISGNISATGKAAVAISEIALNVPVNNVSIVTEIPNPSNPTGTTYQATKISSAANDGQLSQITFTDANSATYTAMVTDSGVSDGYAYIILDGSSLPDMSAAVGPVTASFTLGLTYVYIDYIYQGSENSIAVDSASISITITDLCATADYGTSPDPFTFSDALSVNPLISDYGNVRLNSGQVVNTVPGWYLTSDEVPDLRFGDPWNYGADYNSGTITRLGNRATEVNSLGQGSYKINPAGEYGRIMSLSVDSNYNNLIPDTFELSQQCLLLFSNGMYQPTRYADPSKLPQYARITPTTLTFKHTYQYFEHGETMDPTTGTSMIIPYEIAANDSQYNTVLVQGEYDADGKYVITESPNNQHQIVQNVQYEAPLGSFAAYYSVQDVASYDDGTLKFWYKINSSNCTATITNNGADINGTSLSSLSSVCNEASLFFTQTGSGDLSFNIQTACAATNPFTI